MTTACINFLLSAVSKHGLAPSSFLTVHCQATEWDNLEGCNLPSQNREGVKDQTLSKAGTRDAENVASPVYHTTQDTNLCVSRFSILPGVHVLEDELQAPVENPPLILYELIFISRENYMDTSNTIFERHHSMP
jgi:hypothetical protein